MERLSDLQSVTVHSREELDRVLQVLSADRSNIHYGRDKVLHATWTYLLNCRAAREERDVYVPFGRDALRRCPEQALELLRHIARSTFGQKKNFEFVFQHVLQTKPTRGVPTRAAADFNGHEYGAEYLTFAMGDAIDMLPTPPGEGPSDWAYGVHRATGAIGWLPPTYVCA